MSCLSTEELAALFDGRLPSARAERGRAHLATCPRCASEIHRLAEMLREVQDPARPAPPDALLAQALRLGGDLSSAVAELQPEHPSGNRDSRPSRKSD